MPRAARAFDTALATTGDAGGHAGSGSPDVIIDNQAALRAGDGGASFQASGGSTGVFIDGLPALRLGDGTQHGDLQGEIAHGSPDVLIGDRRPGTPRARPHDKSVALHVTDALGRPVHEVAVSTLCPHEDRPAQTVDGTTTIGGLCDATTLSVHKSLQQGAWDPGASRGAHPQVTTRKAKAASAGSGDPVTGGAGLPGDPSGSGAVVTAPAPSGTPTSGAGVHVPKASGPTQVVLATTHNWVQLVYEAFGQKMPTGSKELALLGVRGASLAAATPKAKLPEATLEADAGKGDLADVVFTTGTHAASGYGDLLFCAWTDASVHHRQYVEVFECDIDASPGPTGPLHLPFLLEGKLFHARPGPFDGAHPGNDVALHVFEGTHEPQPPKEPSPEEVIAKAMSQRGITESPAGSNNVLYGRWYGDNYQPWCAMFVSWCFAQIGMPFIRYSYCPYGIDDFKSGAFGTWLGPVSHAEPGDIVFYQWNGPGTDSDHTGIVVHDDASYLTTVEGNTSADNNGSQSNGGGVYLRHRDRHGLELGGLIAGFGRPKYPKPVTVPRHYVRWGNEGAKVHGASINGSTMLRHHYWETKHGKQVPDPAATRYRRFMQLYNEAKNKGEIPYLVVSSSYVETYADWVTALAQSPGATPKPGSVLLESGLVAPAGHPGHYLPSFISKAYADKVLARAKAMHDHHAAAQLRDALLGATFTVSK
jgi:uncharacterized Zn-binding protein involved in type VI secretion